MIQNSLKQQHAATQFLLLLMVWGIFTFTGSAIQLFYLKQSLNIPQEQINQFISNELYKHPNESFVVNALSQLFMFFFPAVIFAYITQSKPFQFLGFTLFKNKKQIVAVVGIAIGLVFLVSVIGYLSKQINWGRFASDLDNKREQFIKTYLQLGKTGAILKSLFLIAVIPAICEELFFRAVLMRFMHTLFKKWWISIVFTSIVFTAFHGSVAQFLPIFLAAIVLGYVYYLTGNLWLNILLHFLFNSVQLLGAVYSSASDQPESLVTILFTLIISLVLVSAFLGYLYKNKTPLPQSWSVTLQYS